MNIFYYEDLVQFLLKAKQNILVVSSALLFEQPVLEIKVVNGDITFLDSELSLHESLLHLMLKKSWTPSDVKALLGYCVIMHLLASMKSDNILKSLAYSAVMDIANGAWRSAFTSNDEIDQYKQDMTIYRRMSPQERLMIETGQVEGMSEPENPLLKNKRLPIYGMEKLFASKNLFSLCREIPQAGDVISLNGEKAAINHFDFTYHFDQTLPEHLSVNKLCDTVSTIDGFRYRIQHVPIQGGGSTSTFRCLGATLKLPTCLDLVS
jgi:hypothetical protein